MIDNESFYYIYEHELDRQERAKKREEIEEEIADATADTLQHYR